ncbi:rRNA processing protein Nop9 [Paecilomyces variotii No. 5]|uniref:Nucleolar protein 9 n=1 Tax=Byssochlamys spectabilis (strain No. 5 / NBRC 109023) TaxID=1356009 RepID=V5G3V3_BYSSN|nr:rRNA processing protein Nop9 [Paecilomyces variotii No. 5]
MPREKQKRGRRAEEKKRKREEIPEEAATKRPKPSSDEQQDDIETNGDYIPFEDGNGEGQNEYESGHPSSDMPFYGLLDTEEQEYFSRASELLELNQFQDAEERQLFVESVYKEAKGKELKIACSQSCSRLMEKLISMSDVHQIRRLFGKFLGHFLHLVQHRFASHCCETLFIHAAPAVSQKPSKRKKEEKVVDVEEGEGEDEVPDMSLADMFLTVVEELQESWGYLLTERFASHTIRVLLLVLAGEPVDVASNTSVVASKKKERLGVTPVVESQAENAISQRRPVPQSFEDTLKKIMKDMTAVLDNTYLRALATHPLGNPVLQVLLSLELSHFGKSSAKDENSIIRRLIPDETLEEGSESALFVRGLLYDPVGSRLLETIVRCAPGKLFKSLYKNGIKERIGSLSRNETASYVVLRVLERLGKDDLQAVVELILPEVRGLVERSRLVVPRVLIERCVVRGVNTAPIAKALEAAYDKDPAARLDQMLKFMSASQQEGQEESKSKEGLQREPENPAARNAEKTHGSLLAQTMLGVSGPLSELIYSSLLAKPSEDILQMSMDPIASRVLQQALTLPTSTAQFRRQFTSRFLGHMNELALHSSGSHVADSLWPATKDIFFIKERLAQELVQNELALRDSFVGRAVWRNWSMDLYKRRRGEWKAKAKGLEPQTENGASSTERPKSRIELARARFAEQTAEKTDSGKKMEAGHKSVAASS